MTAIFGAIRKFFGYPWQKDWPEPPFEAQQYSGGGIPFAANVFIAATLLRHGFQEFFSEGVGNLIFLIFILLSGAFLFVKNENWHLWIWKDGAILQRGFERIELSTDEISRFREVGISELFLIVASKRRRYTLSLESTSNLLGLRNQLGQIQTKKVATSAVYYRSIVENFSPKVTALLCATGFTLGIFELRESLFPKGGSPHVLVGIYCLVVLACLAYFIWSLIRYPRTHLSLDNEGISHRRIFRTLIAWKDVTKVNISEVTRSRLDSMTIETDHQKITIPASIPDYWHLEKQILERIPISAQVTRL